MTHVRDSSCSFDFHLNRLKNLIKIYTKNKRVDTRKASLFSAICFVSNKMFTRAFLLWLLSSISLSVQQTPDADSAICPDGRTECFERMTCCPLRDGRYGCCPFSEATCCSDGLHCCPTGTTCDVQHGMCRRDDGDFHMWVGIGKPVNKTFDAAILEEHVPAKSGEGVLHSTASVRSRTNAAAISENRVAPPEFDSIHAGRKVACQDGNSSCADGYTCCTSPFGDHTCCPLVDAVCCPDHIHCCPKGSTCDTKAGKCTQQTISFSAPVEKHSVICPGGQYQCPDRTTCCPMGYGQYGCCPFESASCCSDLLHCCPAGYRCSITGSCFRANDPNLPWLEEKPQTLPAIKID